MKIQLQLLHSEKLSALGRLASSIAHEFGNPLIGIKYLLTDFTERPFLSKEDQRLLLQGMDECDRMTKLLKNLGQLNRPTTGKRSYASIHKIMNNVLFFQSKHIKSQQLTIVKNYAVDLPDVLVIQDQISQVLLKPDYKRCQCNSRKWRNSDHQNLENRRKYFFVYSRHRKRYRQEYAEQYF